MRVANAYVHGHGKSASEDAASPSHNFVQNSGDDPAVNGVDKAGVPGTRSPSGDDLRTVGVKSEVQAVGIVFSADKTGLCLRQRFHCRQINGRVGSGKLELETRGRQPAASALHFARPQTADNPPLLATVFIDLLRRACLSRAVIYDSVS